MTLANGPNLILLIGTGVQTAFSMEEWAFNTSA